MAKNTSTNPPAPNNPKGYTGQSKLETFVVRNQKRILQIVGGLAALAALAWGYYYFIHAPKEIKASEELAYAQQAIASDSANLALNGNAMQLGLLDIIDEYSFTDASNLAEYYAGIAYLELGQPEDAIAHLEEFSSDDGVLSSLALGLIGDAFMELNQPKDAEDYYSQAAEDQPNNFLTPYFLKKAATVAEIREDYRTALSYYKQIKTTYGTSMQAEDVDALISYCEAKINNQ
jgi:tetratricopeptide (TPR) repeat protein